MAATLGGLDRPACLGGLQERVVMGSGPLAVIPGGYILVARRIAEVDAWLMSKPPLYSKLWLWMLAKANFKDRDKLKRGQFVTTIDEMREAMSYQVGYRKMVPTKDEIRAAYRAFTENPHEDHMKPPMITTSKTTRGMIINICNYEKYQNPKNYENHTEDHNEDRAQTTATPHDTEECLKKKKEKNLHPDALRLSGLLANLIADNNPNNRSIKPECREKSIQDWAVDIGRIFRLDERSVDEVEAVVRWCQGDEFWKTNILSGAKLRKQYDQLIMQMNRGEVKSAAQEEEPNDFNMRLLDQMRATR